ncbi:MAG: MFS transporter [Chloroflexota bacterium]
MSQPISKPEIPFYRIVLPLAVAETLVWAAVYYMFPALLLTWETQLPWSKAELSGAFTLAIVVSALLAPVVGRLIDHGQASKSFTGAAILATVMLVLLSFVQALWQFYVIWFFLGVAMSGMLYEATFTVLTRAMGEQRKRAITLVTLVAGFAGTLSFPGNAFLIGQIGWRNTMYVLAAIVALVAAPLIWYACRLAERIQPNKAISTSKTAVSPLIVLKKPVFWLLAVGFITLALDHGMLLTHLLPLLDERGVSGETAVFAASMIGPMQVTGRLLMMFTERYLATLQVFAACFIALVLASIALFSATSIPILLAVFIFFQGTGAGVTSIMRPLVISELLGSENFGVIAGMLAIPFLIGAAAAPTVAALIWEAGGYGLVIQVAGGAIIVGFAALLLAAAQVKSQEAAV